MTDQIAHVATPAGHFAGPPINIHVHGELGDKDRARLLKILEREKPVTLPVKAAPAKPGYKTTELLVAILTAVGAIAAAAQGSLPPRYAALAGTIASVAYILSRGQAKR